MGGIGRAFARRARALGMTIVYHNRNRLSPDLEDGASYVSSLDELLSTSDVVSLNLPLNAKTRHTIGREQFKRMKKSAILINTARGPVVDEKALVDALEQGEIAGCGLDVYENEPKIEEGLVKLEREGKAFLLPHVGYVLPLSFLRVRTTVPVLTGACYQDLDCRDSARDGECVLAPTRHGIQDGKIRILGSGAEGAILMQRDRQESVDVQCVLLSRVGQELRRA